MRVLRELSHYRSAVIGLFILAVFIIVSLYTIIAIPYNEAIRLWRAGPGVWEDSPRRAEPIWFDWFTGSRLPRTIVTTLDNRGETVVQPLADGMKQVTVSLPFEYVYDGFPSELSIYTTADFLGGRYNFDIFWEKPNGERITLSEGLRFSENFSYRISQDMNLRMRLGSSPHVGLLAVNPAAATPVPKHGEYRLIISGIIPAQAEISTAKLVVYGQIHGLAGTDHLRRDLMIALLWGTPIGLLFGVLAAVGAQVSTFVLAGIGTWFGGKLDALFHRITEVTMVLPLLAILIMIGQFHSRSIWVMLGTVILLNVFSASMKVYRAMFLQAKELPYIEAAQAYGAGNFRIIFKYLLPRLMPILLPQFVTVIPTFVFLEATLAVLGLGDPVIPTWGKIIYDARVNDALYMGDYYWVVLPAVLLMLIGFGFALVGYSLDRIFNPRLRTMS